MSVWDVLHDLSAAQLHTRTLVSDAPSQRKISCPTRPCGWSCRHRPSAHPEGSFYVAVPAPGAWLDAAAQEQRGAVPPFGVLPGTTFDPKGLW